MMIMVVLLFPSVISVMPPSVFVHETIPFSHVCPSICQSPAICAEKLDFIITDSTGVEVWYTI